MKLVPLYYLLLLPVLFIIFHIAVENFKLGNTANAILSIGAMLVVQYFVYFLLKQQSNTVSYLPLYLSLVIAQTLIIIFLSLNSAFNPFVENKPINLREVAVSLIAFAIVLPAIIAAIILFVHNKW
jgi:hypothetical protein